MQCPKCKNYIADDVLRCPHCNLKIKIVCPKCKTINLMGKKSCVKCGFKFFTICPECHTINLSGADFCRKCKTSLKKTESSQSTEIKSDIENQPVVEQSNPKIQDTISEQETPVIPEPTKQVETQLENFANISTQEYEEYSPDKYINEDDEIQSDSKPEITEILTVEEVEDTSASGDFTDTDSVIEEESSIRENEDEQQPEDITSEEIISEEEVVIEKEEVPQYTDDGFLISSDNVELSDEQLGMLIQQVEEIDKSQERRAEVESSIQEKFEQQEKDYQEVEEQVPPEYVQLDQKSAQTEIIDAIHNPIKKIISLNAKEGYGKTLILKYVREALRKNNYIWCFGECNALTQITPFGYIQDVLLNLFNLSNFSVNIDDFIKNNTKPLEVQFYNLNPQEINDLFNFLYPTKQAAFNGILKRKEYTISILKKVFENFSMKSMLIFAVDDFENIDGASFDFIQNLLDDEKFNDKFKILITNKHNKIAQGYFANKNLKPNNFSNIFLSALDKQQLEMLISSLYGTEVDFPQGIKNQIFENSKGSSAYVEQVCLLLSEINALKSEDGVNIEFNSEFAEYVLPNTIYRIIEERLSNVEKEYPVIVKVLYFASLLGNKFSISQLQNILQILQIDSNNFKMYCDYLIGANYFTMISENYFSFNNTLIWHYIYERAKADEQFEEFNRSIYNAIEQLTLSNNSLKPLLLQNFDNKKDAFLHWQKNADLACYLGDTNLYVISLKQQLKFANDVADVISAKDKINIFEKMGKILYKISPKEALNYLSAAIAFYKEEGNNNPARIIELSGFLVQACIKTGDYLGVIEVCDVATETLPAGEYTIEKALILSKKLDALLYLGNCEEVINTANTELLDIMEEALSKANSSNIVSDEMIFKNWMQTSLNLASAYAIQGSQKVFDVLTRIEEAINSNKIEDSSSIMNVLIIKALANAVRGESKLSSEILTTITSKYSTDIMTEDYILRWNFINILNKIASNDCQDIVNEMYQVTTFADNIDDSFTKNLLKLLLGYIIQSKSNNTEKALEIYKDESVFFSKEKIATGVLLSWYLIAYISYKTKDYDFALDIALKALDVAKGPKINNYLFIVALKRLIADIYMYRNDYEATKMYLEKAMTIAKQCNLKYMEMFLYQSFGKYNEKMLEIYKDNAQEFAQAATEMYSNSIKIAQSLSLVYYEVSFKKTLTAFKAFCQLKNITVIVED